MAKKPKIPVCTATFKKDKCILDDGHDGMHSSKDIQWANEKDIRAFFSGKR